MKQSTLKTHIYAVSDLRRNLTTIIQRLSRNEKIFISRHGRGIAVMLSMDTYNGICDEKEQAEQSIKNIELELLKIEKEFKLNPDRISARTALTRLRATISTSSNEQ